MQTLALAANGTVKMPIEISARIQSLIKDGYSDAQIAAEVREYPADVIADKIKRCLWREIYADEICISSPELIAEAKRSRVAEWQASVALKAMSASMKGFKLAQDAGEAGDPRAFSDAARATKTFVDITRQAEGIDNGDTKKGESASIHFWVARVGENGIREIDNAIDVSARSVAPVAGEEMD